MNVPLSREELIRAGVPGGTLLSREERLEIIARAYDRLNGRVLRTVGGIEDGPEEDLGNRPTKGTAFEEAVAALNAAEIPTEPNLLDLMKQSRLSRLELHEITCACNDGEFITSYEVADHFRLMSTMGRGFLDKWRDAARVARSTALERRLAGTGPRDIH
jgi:hypothetical protein